MNSVEGRIFLRTRTGVRPLNTPLLSILIYVRVRHPETSVA